MLKNIWGATHKWSMRWGNRASSFIVVIGGGRPLNLNEVRATEEALKNSAAVATVGWVQRNFSEAPLVVGRLERNDVIKVVQSPLIKKMKRPNEFYGGKLLMKAVVWDLCFSGNAYILKQRKGEGGANGRGRVDSLWWVPSFCITPMKSETNDKIFIDHYQYEVNSKKEDIPVEDVIHFREGFDPENPMLGMSKFKALLKEVCSDNEANMWIWSLLKNMGVPGVILSPGKDVEINSEDAEKMKDDFVSRFTGSNRGMPMVTTAQIEAKTLAFDAQQMDLTGVRHVAEERMTAMIGVPAVVVGLGAGLIHSTFANYAEARKAGYENCLIPFQSDIAEVLEMSLLPEFHNPDNYCCYYDISKVRVLQDDINAAHVRVRGNLLSGILTLNEALIEIGREPIGPNGDVRFIPNGVTATSNENLVVQLPAAGAVPTDTGDEEDDVQGNPEGGAPTREEDDGNKDSPDSNKALLTRNLEKMLELVVRESQNGAINGN